MKKIFKIVLIMFTVFFINFSMSNIVMADDIAEALDTYIYSFYADDWVLENAGSDDFVCTIDNMSDYQSAFFQASVTSPEVPKNSGNYVPGRIMFKWKVNSEKNYDKLIFEVDNVVKKEISGDTGWIEEYFDVSAGTHLLRWTYIKDGDTSRGDDKAYVDFLTIVQIPDNNLAIGLDLRPPDAKIKNISTDGWEVANEGSQNDWLQNKSIGNNQMTYLKSNIILSWNANISFRWRVSSESGYDFLRFKILQGNQVLISSDISGEIPGWIYESFDFPSIGQYEIRWEYDKDRYVKRSQDKGFVDRVKIKLQEEENIAFGLTKNKNIPYVNQGWHVATITDGAITASDDDLKHSEKAKMQILVPASRQGRQISFKWKVSSEKDYDWLIFRAGFQEKMRISGDIDWEIVTFRLPGGYPGYLQTLEWEYKKDGNTNRGWDQGFIRDLVIE